MLVDCGELGLHNKFLIFFSIGTYLIVQSDENKERAKPSCSEGVESLEEEDEL